MVERTPFYGVTGTFEDYLPSLRSHEASRAATVLSLLRSHPDETLCRFRVVGAEQTTETAVDRALGFDVIVTPVYERIDGEREKGCEERLRLCTGNAIEVEGERFDEVTIDDARLDHSTVLSTVSTHAFRVTGALFGHREGRAGDGGFR